MHVEAKLFRAMSDISNFDNSEKIISFFCKELSDYFKPAKFYFSDEAENKADICIEIPDGNDILGFICSNDSVNENSIELIQQSIIILGSNLSRAKYKNQVKNCIDDKNSNTENSRLNEIDKYIKELENAKIATLNLVEDLTSEIKEKEKAQKTLEASENKYRSLVESAPNGIFVSDDKGLYVEINEAAEYLTGYSREELLKMNMMDFIHEDSVKDAKELFETVLSTGRSSGDVKIRRKDGGIRFWTVDAVVIGFSRFLGFVVDITDRKTSEIALKASEDKFRTAFMTSPDSININRLKDGLYIDINEGFEKIMGFTREEVIGTTSIELDIWYDPEQRKQLVKELLSKGYVENFEAEFVTKSGVIKTGLMSAKIIFMNNEDNILSITRDISERKRTELALEKKIVSLTQPLEGAEGIGFDNLFNIDDIQAIQDNFSNATGVASIITDPDGNPITKPSNFCRLCRDIIRKSEIGLRNCIKSDAVIGRHLTKGPRIQHCLSGGLWDAGAAITVGGKHIANWLIGQVRDESQDIESISKYADEIKVDKDDFIKAYKETTKMSLENFEKIAQALNTIANQISTSAYQNIQQARFITERKQALKELQENEQLLRTITENYPNSYISIIANDYTIDFTSGQEFKNRNLNPELFLGLTIDEVFQDKADLVKSYFAKTFKGEEQNYELFFGNQHQLYKTVPLFSEDGSIQRILVVAENISERKKAEDALRKSEERYRSIFNNTAIGIGIRTMKNEYIEFNDYYSKMLGYSQEELKGKKTEDITHPDDIPLSLKNLEEIKNGIKKVCRYEKRYLRKDGSPVWGEVSIQAMKDSNNQPFAITGVVTDISERKKVEDEILAKNEFLNNVIESITFPFYAINAEDYSIEIANSAAKSDSFREGIKCYELRYGFNKPCGNNGIECPIEMMKDSLKPAVLEHQVKDKNGVSRTHEVTAFPILENGRLKQIIEYSTDIEYRKKAEQELQKLAKLESLGLLGGGIAHNFKNILANISFNASLAKYKPEKTLKYLEKVEKAVVQATALASRFQTFSTGGAPIINTISIRETVEDSVNIALAGSNISFEISFDESLRDIDGDAKQLNEVFMNLLINSKQAMPKGGHIEILCKNVSTEDIPNLSLKPGKYTMVSITDNGSGIKKEKLSEIFDPFYTNKVDGTGLGLTTAQSIIQKHNGSITVDSEYGKWTCFKIYLPSSQDKAPVSEKTNDYIREGRGLRALFMDDNPDLRENVSDMGDLLDYHIDTAKNGPEAIDLYKKSIAMNKKYDAVILDLTIQGSSMQGEDVLLNLKQIDPEVKAIVFSGHSAKPIVKNYKDFGFKGKLDKPVTIEKLSEVIDKVCKSP